jgi:HAE1 family hydrophobic/amphiphilic exporter-1
VLALAFGVFVASLGLLPFLGAEFLPAMDQGQVEVMVEMPRGTPLEATDGVVARVEEAALSLPEVESVLATSGAVPGTARSSEVGYVQIRLKKKGERTRSSLEIAEEMRKKLSSLPVQRLSVRSGGGARGSQAAVQVEIRGEDLEKLRSLGRDLEEKMARVPGIRNLSSNLSQTLPEIRLFVDRAELAARGLSPAQVGAAVRLALRGEVATRYRVGAEELDVRVRVGGELDRSPERILDLPLALPGGGMVRLGEVARMEPGSGPPEISRLDRARTVRLTADVAGRSLGAVYRDISSLTRSLELPPGYTVELGGEQKNMMESFSALGKALLAGILLVYMILAAQFESLLHPFTILVSVPLGITGALGGLALTGRTLNISSFIGIIMLTGIVVSNAIILVDYALLLHRGGLPRREAVMRAGALRLRPVLMTTLTTVLGLLPLALGIGEGAEFQAPMATAVLFGLLFSTLLTLIVVPVIYTLVDDLGLWMGRRGRRGRGRKREESGAAPLPEPAGVAG